MIRISFYYWFHKFFFSNSFSNSFSFSRLRWIFAYDEISINFEIKLKVLSQKQNVKSISVIRCNANVIVNFFHFNVVIVNSYVFVRHELIENDTLNDRMRRFLSTFDVNTSRSTSWWSHWDCFFRNHFFLKSKTLILFRVSRFLIVWITRQWKHEFEFLQSQQKVQNKNRRENEQNETKLLFEIRVDHCCIDEILNKDDFWILLLFIRKWCRFYCFTNLTTFISFAFSDFSRINRCHVFLITHLFINMNMKSQLFIKSTIITSRKQMWIESNFLNLNMLFSRFELYHFHEIT